MPVRRSNREILEALINAIPVNSTLPLKTIALRADVDYSVAKRNMELIEFIQSQALVEKNTIGEQTGYSKKSRAGRPPKK
jgi:hypothetical protein